MKTLKDLEALITRYQATKPHVQFHLEPLNQDGAAWMLVAHENERTRQVARGALKTLHTYMQGRLDEAGL